MTKQTFTIPEGCKAVTVEQVGNQIITTFEPVFKRGDVIYCEDNDLYTWIFIFESENTDESNQYKYFCLLTGRNDIFFNSRCRTTSKKLRHATPEETQRLLDALAKKGKRWNPEKMQVEEIKKEIPRAKFHEDYYFVGFGSRRIIKSHETEHRYDYERHEIGNYFLTEEQAQRAAEKIKQALANFWEEELK